MKIIEAINRIDSLKHNTYSRSDKVAWLSELDAMAKVEIVDTHEGVDKEEEIAKYIQGHKKAYEASVTEYMKVHEVTREEAEKNVVYQEIKYKDAKEHIEATRNDISFKGYDDSTDIQTELLITAPYDNAYLLWMEAKIDYYNGEYDSYNNAILLFNTVWEAFKKHYTSTHKPLQHGRRFLF